MLSLIAIKQSFPIKYFMVLYLGLFLAVSGFALSKPAEFWMGLAIVFIYTLFDLLWTRLRDGIWYLPVSSWISGFILALIATPSFLGLFILPAFAVISKQLIHLRKMRHIFNPAAFALVLTGFFLPSTSWWGVSWGNIPLAIIFIMGLIIIWRQRRWETVGAFLGSYAIFLTLLFFYDGFAVSKLLGFLRQQLLDGTTLFFTSVMLIEPLTSTFPTKRQEIIYAILVAVFSILLSWGARFANSIIPGFEPLLFSLLLGNLFASLLFLRSKKERTI